MVCGALIHHKRSRTKTSSGRHDTAHNIFDRNGEEEATRHREEVPATSPGDLSRGEWMWPSRHRMQLPKRRAVEKLAYEGVDEPTGLCTTWGAVASRHVPAGRANYRRHSRNFMRGDRLKTSEIWTEKTTQQEYPKYLSLTLAGRKLAVTLDNDLDIFERARVARA